MKAASFFGALTLAHPQALYALAIVALVCGWSLWQAGALRRMGGPLMRAVAAALFVIALADPQSVIRSQGSARPAVIDASASITPAMRDFAAKLLTEQLRFRSADPAILFAGRPVPETIGDAAATLHDSAGCAACMPAATDLETALTTLANDPDARGGPVVLVTDGWQNRGNADNAVNALRAAGIALYIFTPPAAGAIANVAITALNLPPALAKAEPFALGVTVANLNPAPAQGSISIYTDGRLTDQRSVTIPHGQARFDFPVRTESAGLLSYRAVFKAADAAQDLYPEDDSLEGWVGIGSQRKVLVLTDSARDAGYLDSVIRGMGLQPTVQVLAGGQFDGSLKGYDAVILNNVARSRLSPAVQTAMVNYAAQGGSLAMVGGDQSFGLGGYEASPIAKAMPVVMKPPQHHERTRALILIIDKSGSMGRNDKLVYAKAAALTVTKTLSDTDLIGVVGFDSQPFVVVPLEPLAKTRPYFDELIDRLKAGGTTYLLPALEQSERMLANSGAAVKHVVILTDGETGGTASMYYDLVSSMHRDGNATISAIAIGQEANTPLLEAISNYGGGGFYQTDSPQTLPQLFLQDVNRRGADTTMVEKDFVPLSIRPDPILKDLAGRQFPPIKGYVSTDLKPGASLSLFVDSGGHRDPVVASWKYGAGKTLAVTTDASGRWSSQWIRNGVFGPLWDKLLEWMTPQTSGEQAPYDVAMGYHAGRVEIRLTDYGNNPVSADHPVDAIVTAPDGVKSETILSEDAPGELAGSIDAAKPGTYYIELKAPRGGGQTFPPLAYTVSTAIDAEVPRPAPNYGLLENLAAATGGRLNPSPADLALTRPKFEQTESLSRYLVVTAMILLIAEALVRRLTF